MMRATLMTLVANKTIGCRSERSWSRKATLDALERRLLIRRREGYLIPTAYGYVVAREDQ